MKNEVKPALLAECENSYWDVVVINDDVVDWETKVVVATVIVVLNVDVVVVLSVFLFVDDVGCGVDVEISDVASDSIVVVWGMVVDILELSVLLIVDDVGCGDDVEISGVVSDSIVVVSSSISVLLSKDPKSSW